MENTTSHKFFSVQFLVLIADPLTYSSKHHLACCAPSMKGSNSWSERFHYVSCLFSIFSDCSERKRNKYFADVHIVEANVHIVEAMVLLAPVQGLILIFKALRLWHWMLLILLLTPKLHFIAVSWTTYRHTVAEIQLCHQANDD